MRPGLRGTNPTSWPLGCGTIFATSVSMRWRSSTCASWGRSTPPAEGSIARQFEALAVLQREGLIRHLGLSNVTAKQVEEAQSIAPVVCVQNHYNLVHRD